MNRIIRRLQLPEIRELLNWAASEGWNPGLDDAVAFQAADPNGFIGAFVDEVMVAGISAVAYDAHFGFIGLYICHPRWRGQGHARAVWDAAMAYLGDRTIGLDGVPEQQANYARMGFAGAYQTIRMSGTLTTPDRPLASAQLEEIGAVDRQCFPARRDEFLRRWVAAPRMCSSHRTDDVLDGYAVSRACQEGHKIGPLFAQSVEASLELLAIRSGPIYIDVPAYQSGWIRELSRLGLEPGFETQRMYRGRPPSIRSDCVFGVSTLELG